MAAANTSHPEFNLLDEPWILVLDTHGAIQELSVLAALARAHELTSLAGELPTQDVAILRLLLAVLHAVFTRVDENGNPAPLTSADEALRRWQTLWQGGQFPFTEIKGYLEHYRERFYLFHPQRPFYQVSKMSKGTEYNAAKLMGTVSESGNKLRLFQLRTGVAKNSLTYAEAARWLLYLNAFDDTSAKPSARGAGLPSTGAGWLGKLGLVYAAGENLFATLMLNLVLLNEKNEIWEDGEAVWERNTVKENERTEIPLPRCQLELLTLQSRRLLLERDGTGVTGYKLLGGDFFPRENALVEQMTKWRKEKESKNQPDVHLPKRHDTSKQLWRDFSALTTNDSGRLPGVISWLALLKNQGILPPKWIRIQAASVKYGDKDFFVDDVWGDDLTLNAALFSTLGAAWVTRITDLLAQTDKCVWLLGLLAKDLSVAAGDKNGGEGKKKAAMEEAYFRLDTPFRSWLAAIDPQTSKLDEESGKWREQVSHTVRSLGQELIAEAGVSAFVGRKDGTNRINAPEAWSKFQAGIKKELDK